ncbi:MAG: HAD family hydrolase [Actinobacteria bacterium HGW-Actinobacteria-1]|jgi:putative hydrolase of the HAD superfamily|nr:MAG: HAD family hydrolase [Actinobacteria bacterium HGW-Actinobacteria-1]
MTLKAVFFDVGNTLLAPFPSVSEVCRQVLAEAGHVHDLSAIDALMPLVDEYYEDRYRADDTFWTDEEETSSVWVGMYSLMCRRLGIEEDAARLARRVYDEFGKPERWAVYADVLPALDRLRVLGLRLGIISNWDGRLVGLLGALGVRERVDVVLSSADVGLRKPDPRIFELACERLGVVPSEAAHVGDHHYSDILGARAVGMTPVLVDRSGRPSLPVGPVPITDFDSLETVLGLS